jgi:hypothetical protein
MRLRLSTPLSIIVFIAFAAGTAFPCSVVRIGDIPKGEDIPKEIVQNAALILRVTALEYTTPPANPRIRTTGVPDSKVRFRVEEIVKGAYDPKDVVLAGYLASQDDWNDRPVPYDFVRREGRHGSCFANMYREGGQFLLMLKRSTGPGPFTSDTEMTVNWYALGPVNEQLRSAEDPWLLWVRKQVAAK